MKPKLLLGLALVLGGGLFSDIATAQQSGVATADKWQWGEVVDGFQMGAILDVTNGLVRCRIRNATTNDLTIKLNDFERVPQIQESTSWLGLAAYSYPQISASGIATRPIIIKAGESVVNHFTATPVLTLERYLKICVGNTNEAILMEQLNKWYADRREICRADTFAFDLVEANWPTNQFAQTSIKLRVVQYFRGPYAGEAYRILYSPVFSLDSSLIQSYINQNNKMHGKQIRQP
jgi:hypothetical protein